MCVCVCVCECLSRRTLKSLPFTDNAERRLFLSFIEPVLDSSSCNTTVSRRPTPLYAALVQHAQEAVSLQTCRDIGMDGGSEREAEIKAWREQLRHID